MQIIQTRCAWVTTDPSMIQYHDEEWGRMPETDDACFEALSLEIFQAGLSWRTILNKREGFRHSFAGFSITEIADFTTADVERLLLDASIVRHRRKIEATIANARAIDDLRMRTGPFRDWLLALPDDVDAVYAALRPHLTHFGRTTCESFLEAIGKIPPPHEPDCWRA